VRVEREEKKERERERERKRSPSSRGCKFPIVFREPEPRANHALHPSPSKRGIGGPGSPGERAFTEQQELDLAGGPLAISAEVLVDLLGPLGGLLLAGGAHGAAHPAPSPVTVLVSTS